MRPKHTGQRRHASLQRAGARAQVKPAEFHGAMFIYRLNRKRHGDFRVMQMATYFSFSAFAFSELLARSVQSHGGVLHVGLPNNPTSQ